MTGERTKDIILKTKELMLLNLINNLMRRT